MITTKFGWQLVLRCTCCDFSSLSYDNYDHCADGYDDDYDKDNDDDYDKDNDDMADFPYVFFIIFVFNICQATQLTNTNTKSWI